MIDYKIACVGLFKTGLTTMGDVFAIIGYNTVCYPSCNDNYNFIQLDDNIKYYCDDNYENNNLFVYEAFTDVPYSLDYKNIYNKYPNSKFILTIRNSDDWFNSIYNFQYIPHHMSKNILKHVFGYEELLTENKEQIINIYNKHNENIIEFFSKTNNLLVINLFKNDDKTNWKLICDFLEVENKFENIKFPISNKNNHKKVDTNKL